MKFSKSNKEKADKRGHVSAEAKTAAAGPTPFFTALGYFKNQSQFKVVLFEWIQFELNDDRMREEFDESIVEENDEK